MMEPREAFNADTGEERWGFEMVRGVDSSPAVVDGAVYVGSGGGYLYAVDG